MTCSAWLKYRARSTGVALLSKGEQTRQLGQPRYESFQMPARLANPRRQHFIYRASLVSVIDPSLLLSLSGGPTRKQHYLRYQNPRVAPPRLSVSQSLSLWDRSQARPANAVKSIRWLLSNSTIGNWLSIGHDGDMADPPTLFSLAPLSSP